MESDTLLRRVGRRPIDTRRVADMLPFEAILEAPPIEIDQDAAMMEGMLAGTLFDPHHRMKIYANSFEAAGSAAGGYDHCIWDRDYGPGSMIPVRIEGQARDDGVARVEYGHAYAERAARDLTTHAQERYKIISRPVDQLFNRRAETMVGEIAAEMDSKVLRHLDLDRIAMAIERGEVLSQEGEPMVDVAVNPFFDTHTGEADDRLYGIHQRPTSSLPPGYPELAADLLNRPTNLLLSIFRRDPHERDMIRETLENLARNEGTDGDVRVLGNLIRTHLGEMEVNKIIDPKMMEFVQPGDPHYPFLSHIKASFERVYRMAVGHLGEISEPEERLIYPLIIHMQERSIPMNVENVVIELDRLATAKEVINHMPVTRIRQIFEGGVQSFGPVDADSIALEGYSFDVLAMLKPRYIDRVSIVYGEDDPRINRMISTLFAPRSRPSARKDASSGGYRTMGSHEIARFDFPDDYHSDEPEHRTYKPITADRMVRHAPSHSRI